MQAVMDYLTSLPLTTLEMVLIIAFLSFIHPTISQPWSLLSISLSMIWLGEVLGIAVAFFFYVLGMIAYYFLILSIEKKVQLEKKPKLIPIFKWLKETASYKHMIAVGIPLVPTYFIKMLLPISEKPFMKYMSVMIGAYIFLTFMNVLLYYGIFVSVLMGEASWITFIVFVIFIIVMYASTHIKNNWFSKQKA